MVGPGCRLAINPEARMVGVRKPKQNERRTGSIPEAKFRGVAEIPEYVLDGSAM